MLIKLGIDSPLKVSLCTIFSNKTNLFFQQR